MLKRGVTLFMREQWKCMEQCHRADENLLRAYGSGLADRSMWCVSAIGCVIRKKQQTKPSSGNLKKLRLFKPWFSRNTSAIAISVEEAIQQTMSNLECIYDNFLTKMVKEPMEEDALLDITLTDKEELARDVNA
ncbi:hypothetical protein AV530_005393 [Patagioenas fasciata monilis]|uniref:Uncharacterized protein n=1 Tax=Patagioenas fasciata monilis TaxID=372326 RepID=A0A1V4JL69_PATFA|nr:hypothetical protein AV530_005393 [Patagioenas fasciata monilis]